jgi:hypothetical protein
MSESKKCSKENDGVVTLGHRDLKELPKIEQLKQQNK